MSKGSTQRPTDKKQFDENYDKIFRKSDTDFLEEIDCDDSGVAGGYLDESPFEDYSDGIYFEE